MDKLTLGRQVSKARRKMQISSEALSEKCNLNAVYIRMIERGVRVPSLNVFISLCDALHVSPNYLLSGNLTCENDDRMTELIERLRGYLPHELDMVEGIMDIIDQRDSDTAEKK